VQQEPKKQLLQQQCSRSLLGCHGAAAATAVQQEPVSLVANIQD